MFDLDDTLYKEIDYLRSAYKEIAERLCADYQRMMDWYYEGVNVFDRICAQFDVEKDLLLNIYRCHKPNIVLSEDVVEALQGLTEQGCVLGIISDGRSVTQWNKIEALGLLQWVERDNIVISEEFGSEKPDESNYRYFMTRYPGQKYTYVGDNPKKDFLAPNWLGWTTMCLRDDGRNIHTQDFNTEKVYQPQQIIDTITDI